ncbi:MAG: sulfite dehydrogenase [Terriglobia bacterium]
MSSIRPGRRRFLKGSAALAGLAVGAGTIPSASGFGIPDERTKGTKYATEYGERSRFETEASKRQHDYPQRPFPAKKLTPLQDSVGIITPAGLHFVADHYTPPDLDPQQHRLLIHGLVDRPLVFTVEELKRLPSVSRIHFLECLANSNVKDRGGPVLDTVQEIHGRTSCSEWTGVPLSVLLEKAGVQKDGTWLLVEGADAGRFSYSIPLGKAMDDVLVAYGQNGEAVRPEQGYPLRLLVPGWEGPYNVKWLRRIKVVDQPYMTKVETILHGYLRPDQKGKALWFQFQMPPKSVITRPAGGQKLLGRGFYEITGLAWSGRGAIRRVEVSTDGGRNWQEAKLQGPVHSMAHTRFRLPWNWDGEETIIQSRCADDQGEKQPSLEELNRKLGVSDDHWLKTSVSAYQFNAVQPWKVSRDGSVHNAMFSLATLASVGTAGGGADHTEH